MRPRSLTFRMRLTLAFGGITFAACAAIIALLYLFMRFVPTYLILSSGPVGESTAPSSTAPKPFPTVGPAEKTTGYSETLQIANVADLLDTLLITGLLIAVLVAAIAGALGWLMAGRALKPLQEIDAAARLAGEGALSHRIAISGPRDEIRGLADTFDHTLDRLERAFTANERFASNAAHELRTPLAASKLVLDTAHAHPGSYEIDELVAQLSANNNRSIDLVEALLTLTALETVTEEGEPVDLAEIAREVDSSASTHLLTAPAILPRTLITLAVRNLVTNAVVHNDDRGCVTVNTGTDGTTSWIEVSNTGALIDDAEVAKLTEPLYRGARTAGGGHGLGLAMVETITARYDGALALTPRPEGGLTARLEFPASTA